MIGVALDSPSDLWVQLMTLRTIDACIFWEPDFTPTICIITGEYYFQNQLWCVNIGEYMFFWCFRVFRFLISYAHPVKYDVIRVPQLLSYFCSPQ